MAGEVEVVRMASASVGVHKAGEEDEDDDKEDEMAGRKTIEAKVVEWFETADVATARVVLGIVAGKVRERERSARPTTQTTRKGKKIVATAVSSEVENAAD